MKGNGSKIRGMEMGLNDIKMVMLTKASFKLISQMVKVHIIGTIMNSTMENGKMDASMV
jgi:hypothetical protein